ncbi:MAG TPA: cupin domain-containing protein [Acidimicrobiales bacterium]|nr:cupin domain-containing protein [Acidimicrobiales bacterium]
MTAQQTPEGPMAYVLRAEEGKQLPLVGVLKAGGGQTGGAFEVVEYQGNAACPPPHVHRQREECFYVLEGQFGFTLGTEQIEAGKGSWVFIPRGTRHCFTATADAKALILVVPAGLEGFFEELGTGLAAGKTSEELRAALKGRFDSTPV